jgi:hypothetical protein
MGHMAAAYLVATPLCSFKAHASYSVDQVVIRNNLFARAAHLGRFAYIEVFDWERSSSSAHCKATIFPGAEIVRFCFFLPFSVHW